MNRLKNYLIQQSFIHEEAETLLKDLEQTQSYIKKLEGVLGSIARREDNVLIQPHEKAKQALEGQNNGK